jgi:hypothetical protein
MRLETTAPQVHQQPTREHDHEQGEWQSDPLSPRGLLRSALNGICGDHPQQSWGIRTFRELVFSREPKIEESDINCIFPLERLRALAELGEIGRVAPRLWSGFMGRIYNRTKITEQSGPEFADALLADNVDVLLAAPS